MTTHLVEYLQTLKSDPADAGSPALLVARDDLSKREEEYVKGASYARRPYAIVAGLPRSLSTLLHNRQGIYAGVIDLALLKPSSSTEERPGTHDMAALMAQIVMGVREQVNELDEGYPLMGRMDIITEIDPRLVSLQRFSGLMATMRLAYTIGR